jgi:3-dehydroquinate synthase
MNMTATNTNTTATNTTIAVRTPSANYDVEIGAGLLASVGERVDGLLSGGIRAGKQRAFVVTSPEIDRLWGKQLAAGFPAPLTQLSVPAGEQHKRLATVERLAEELAQHGADRDSILLAFGGGVIGDMTGFLAAMYMRGIRYVQLPTTLLAQVDSSVGGKTGVNLAAGKNLVGAFHHPLAVYADTATLSTLPAAELRAGLQESVKAGIIRDCTLFDLLDSESAAVLSGDREALTRVVAASVRVKADVVNADERELGVRMILNLGHTLGHAIEVATGYKQLLHGEAVAWGMIAAIGIAMRRGMVSAADAEHMERVIRAYGPLHSFTADASDLVALTAKDKKNRSGARSFVLPVGIGEAVVVRDVSEAELLEAATLIVAEANTAGVIA